ncbi:hypothetical protein ABZ293_10620, partial [Nocardia sp. NPDC005998]
QRTITGADRRVAKLAVGGIGSGVLDCGGVDRRVIDIDDLRIAMQQCAIATGQERTMTAVGHDQPRQHALRQ